MKWFRVYEQQEHNTHLGDHQQKSPLNPNNVLLQNHSTEI